MVVFPPARKWKTRDPCLCLWLVLWPWAITPRVRLWFSQPLIVGFSADQYVFQFLHCPLVAGRSSSGPFPVRVGCKRYEGHWGQAENYGQPTSTTTNLKNHCFRERPSQVYRSLCNVNITLSTLQRLKIFLFSFEVDMEAKLDLRCCAVSDIC